MAGMFYSLQEVAKKLNVTENQVTALVKQGRLREFRDGPNLLFKVDEVEALLSDTAVTKSPADSSEIELQLEDDKTHVGKKTPAPPQQPEEDEYKLAEGTAASTPSEDVNFDELMLQPDENQEQPAEPAAEDNLREDTAAVTDQPPSDNDLLDATTAAPSGDNVTEDLLAETAAEEDKASLEKIEEDVSLDSFGSGSGLLDLSLQADDTSLGGILDEIYTDGQEKEKEAVPGASAMEPTPIAAESIAEEITEPQHQPAMQAIGYVEPQPDTASNVLGLMLFLPMIAVLYTATVITAGSVHLVPTILKSVQSFIWYIMIAFIVVALVMTAVGFIPRTSGPKVAKPKVKKEEEPKSENEKKEKKPKREKKKKEEEKK
jgi:excisionase family DNA binding protein